MALHIPMKIASVIAMLGLVLFGMAPMAFAGSITVVNDNTASVTNTVSISSSTGGNSSTGGSGGSGASGADGGEADADADGDDESDSEANAEGGRRGNGGNGGRGGDVRTGTVDSLVDVVTVSGRSIVRIDRSMSNPD